MEIKYSNGSPYYPDFVTDEYIIEVKGAYFSEIHDHKNTEHEKDYVVVGKELLSIENGDIKRL